MLTSRFPGSTTISRPSPANAVTWQASGRAALPLLLAWILVALPTVASAGVRDDHPNLVGGELLGRGFAATLNYERFLNNHFGVGAGVMAIGTSVGTVSVVPLYASFLTGDTHSLYLSAGGVLVSGGGAIQDYASTWVLQGTLGYHFQSPGGFFVRPHFTFNQAASDNSGGFIVWPGLTIGGSF